MSEPKNRKALSVRPTGCDVGLGDVAEFLRQFQNTQAALRQLRVGVPLLRLRRCRCASHAAGLTS